MFSCYMTYIKVKASGECSEGVSQSFHSNFVIVNCVTIFITCEYIVEEVKIPEWIHKLMISGGGCTFGIYLMHIFFLRKLSWVEKLWGIFRDEWCMNYMVTAFLICGIVYLLGYIVSLILKKIPLLNNLI